MSQKLAKSTDAKTVLADNPLEGEEILRDAVFGRSQTRMSPKPVQRQTDESKPTHYKIVSISLYNEDIEGLNEMVRELKRRGYYKANKSQLIRHALKQLDLESLPKTLEP